MTGSAPRTVASLYALLFRTRATRKREAFIQAYRFPPVIAQKVQARYPHLTERDTQRVIDGLRTYFAICNQAGRRMVSMPSQVVDVAWHEMILFTRAYANLCRSAFGRFLHHVPAEAMKTRTLAQAGIKRAWRLSCLRESIDPDKPSRLPLLFALDTELDIPDGFRYVLDCTHVPDRYCGSHVGCGGGCGGASCGGSGGPSSGDGGIDAGCGGGCGGD